MAEDKYAIKETGGSSSGSSTSTSGGMMDSFTTLGTKIHEDSLESMAFAQQLETARRQAIRQKRLDAEDKRRFNVGTAQARRGQNMNSLQMLAGQRQMAGANARSVSFNDALAGAMSGGK